MIPVSRGMSKTGNPLCIHGHTHLLKDRIFIGRLHTERKMKKRSGCMDKAIEEKLKKIEEEILLKRKNPLFDIGKNGNVSFSLNGENNWVRKIDIQEYGTL